MSNFSFLIENASYVQKYPWLSIIYKDAVVTEYTYFEESKRRIFREARNVLESMVQCYIEEKNIKIKKYKKKASKKGESDRNIKKKVDFDSLCDKINAIKPSGALLIQAHAVRVSGNNAIHQYDYTGDGREFDCLKNLHDVILWLYNDLTGENITQEFQISKIETKLTVSDQERFQSAMQLSEQKDNEKTKKIKRKRNSKQEISIVQDEEQIIVVDNQGTELFAFTPTKAEMDQVKSKISHLVEMMQDISTYQKNVNHQIRTCITDNQHAYTEIQNQIGKLDLQQENAQAMLEWFAQIQKEQHELLTSKIIEIEQQIIDKESVITFLQELLLDRDSKITYLYNRIDNLVLDVEILCDTLKNVDVKRENRWIGQWYLEAKSHFEQRRFSEGAENNRSYTGEQMRQLFEAFKQKYNRVYFLYESEKIISAKKDIQIGEYEYQINQLRRENLEKDKKLEERRSKIEKQEKKHQRSMRLARGISWFLIIALIGSLLYAQFQKSNALAYKEQYDVLFEKISSFMWDNKEGSETVMQENSESKEEQDNIKDETPTDIEEDSSSEKEEQNSEITENVEVKKEQESMDNKYGIIENRVYTAADGSYQIEVPIGWDIYTSGDLVYLGNSSEVLESDMFYLSTNPVFTYDETSMNTSSAFWENNVFFIDFDYSEYGGRPAIKEYNYVTFEINGKKGGNILLTYNFAGNKTYEFNFVDRDRNGDLESIAERMMSTIVFLDEERVEEDTEKVLVKLASDMLEAFFVRQSLGDTLIHLSTNYVNESGEFIAEMLAAQPGGDFYYEVEVISYEEESAVAKIHMGRTPEFENTSTMRFVKEGNAWKIDYFDK